MQRPHPNEYATHYQPYIDLVENGDFFELIALNKKDVTTFFKNIPQEKYDYRYAANKWTIKQVILHIIDTERVFSYRALTCARGDKSPLPFMDENKYAENAIFPNRTMKSLIREFEIVRESSILLFENITEEQSKLIGTIGGKYDITARALGYLIMGHAIHHINIIKERYL
jgi:uncharacterized damage-inducible protein DinB